MKSVLFVCLGNICRSPAGEAVMRHMAEQKGIEDLIVSSCGIGDWHIGEMSDQRMCKAGNLRGYLIGKRAEQFQGEFLDQYDYILASDHEVMKQIFLHAKSPEHNLKIMLATAFSKSYKGEELPDPYYLSDSAFDEVITMLEDCCEGFFKQLT
jgi:protein-tyrosine phosphatase